MISSNKLILATGVLLAAFANFAFFKNTLEIYPLGGTNSLFLVSLFITICCINILLLGLLGIGRFLKPLLFILLMIAASSAYFMDSYNIIVDKSMLENVVETDLRETRDLLSFKLLAYIAFLFLIPSALIYRLKIRPQGIRKAFISRSVLLISVVVALLANVFAFSMYYTSFVREHKILRNYITPAYPLYSAVKFMGRNLQLEEPQLQPLGRDASTHKNPLQREIIVLVVGEAARADHFSLNGYNRQTNPLLEAEDIISFTNVWSCGTSTAASVPCMFSYLDRDHYKKSAANQLENSLDILKFAGVDVVWLDNNSSSKGVAKRMNTLDFRNSENNTQCEHECRDVGMLGYVEELITQNTSEDLLIVLHQMGSHGPAYYKRYPIEFEKFKPVCLTNQLEQCSQEEVTNAYDNTILYTDYFLNQLINLLKKTGQNSETAMLYISDHGESLGENNLYLHGLPYMLAPDNQKRVPMIMWFNAMILANDINYQNLLAKKDSRFSHDNLFHTLLGLFEIDSEIYSQQMDIIHHRPEPTE